MSQRNLPDMKQNLFTYLPSEIIINILSRLPVRGIISCKCVCKSWLGLVETREFVKSHLSKAVPGLAVYQFKSKIHNFFEFEDGLDTHQPFKLHCNRVTRFGLSCRGWISGSANGLLFLVSFFSPQAHSLHICNPITRDYIEVHCPQEFVYTGVEVVTYGFGVSKMIGQHKVVRIFQDYEIDPESHDSLLRIPKSETVCHVYTIGAGSWRRVAQVAHLIYLRDGNGTFVNGNLHWLVSGLNRFHPLISCFDLETEIFSTFSAPPFEGVIYYAGLSALGDCLCLCDNHTSIGAIEIWLMKEYGVEKSWTKEFVITRDFNDLYFLNVIYPIKLFKNGDILMESDHDLSYYSKENNTTQKIDMLEPNHDINAMLHTPSFLSLGSFEIENVGSF